MSEHDALLAAIIAAPEEDMPRLAYADWLDEHGEHGRAEFTRVQIELAYPNGWQPTCPFTTLSPGSCHCKAHIRRRKLPKREEQLWNARSAWLPGYVPHGCYVTLRFADVQTSLSPLLEFRRGFAESARCTSPDWLAYGDAICKLQPLACVILTSPYLSYPNLESRWPGVAFLFAGYAENTPNA